MVIIVIIILIMTFFKGSATFLLEVLYNLFNQQFPRRFIERLIGEDVMPAYVDRLPRTAAVGIAPLQALSGASPLGHGKYCTFEKGRLSYKEPLGGSQKALIINWNLGPAVEGIVAVMAVANSCGFSPFGAAGFNEFIARKATETL